MNKVEQEQPGEMMADKRWKQQERRVAAFFNTSRTPLSGSHSKQTASDSLHPNLFVECKDRKRHALLALFDKTKIKAKAEGKVPVLCLTEPRRRGFLICLCSDDFVYDGTFEVQADGKSKQIGILFAFADRR